MKLKSLLSLLLCFLLIWTPALAQTESEAMQKTLEHAKTMLTIPGDYTEFSYRSQRDTDGTLYWHFSWSGEQKGSIEATLSETGFLARYYEWVYTESYDDSLANYTHDEAREIAKEFVRKVNPQRYSYLEEDTPNGENRNSRTAYFVFREFWENTPSFGNTVTVTVDKYHGIVRNYQSAKPVEEYPQIAAELTESEAKELYLRDIGICLEYRLYYDYQEKTYKVFPIYCLKDTSGKAIHAGTGEVVGPYIPESVVFGTYRGMNSMADQSLKAESAGGVVFTPEELEAIANLEDVYSQEEALAVALKKIPALKDFSLHTASLQKDYREEDKLLWSFRLKNEENSYANVTMNAKTAQLTSFSLPSANAENKDLSKEAAQKLAEAFLQKEAADVFDKTAYTNEGSTYVPLTESEGLPGQYYFTYQRMENGIPVNGNYLTVRVDAATKQIGSYSRVFTEGISFPDLSNCMSETKILEVMDEQMDFTRVFLPAETSLHSLTYTFLHPEGHMFDPYTGKLLNYDGTFATQTFLPEYTDLHGHWAESMILTLLDNGYYIPEAQFCPDQTITKKEFLKFFQMIGNDTEEELNHWIAELEKTDEADCNAPLTKEVAAGYLMHRMGYEKIAELDHIFRYPFSDEEEGNAKWKGDITLAAGFGIFRGDTTGNFHPRKQLTRGEAASILYHFLKFGH